MNPILALKRHRRSQRITGLAWLGLWIGVGCRAPDLDAPYPVDRIPERWSVSFPATKTEGATGTPWWRDFGDGAVDALLHQLRDGNPSLEAALARRDAAAAQARIAGAARAPQSAIGLSRSRQLQRFVGLPLPGGGDSLESQFDNSQLAINVDWELDLWGRLRAAKAAAQFESQAQQADLEALWHSLIAQCLTTWVRYLEATQLAEIAAQTEDSLSISVTLQKNRYERGLLPLDGLEAMRNAHSQAVANRERWAANADALGRSLATLLGDYPTPLTLDGTSLSEPHRPIQPNLPANVILNRPDLRAVERRIQAADQKVWQARAALLPRIALTGSTGTVSSDLSNLADPDFSVWSLAGGATLPLFQGGRLRGVIQLEEARQQAVVAQFNEAILNALREVETALRAESALQKGLEQARYTHIRLDASQKRRQARYRRGLASRNDALEAERAVWQAQAEETRALAALLENRVALRLALGTMLEAPSDALQPTP